MFQPKFGSILTSGSGEEIFGPGNGSLTLTHLVVMGQISKIVSFHPIDLKFEEHLHISKQAD